MRKRKSFSRKNLNSSMVSWSLSETFILFLFVGVFLGIIKDSQQGNPKPSKFYLGPSTVTQYSHKDDNEIYGRWTASGYLLTDKDAGIICAVSRDWWKGIIKPGDLLEIEGHGSCFVMDTMANKNSKGKAQRRWVDIYQPSQDKAKKFGLSRRKVWLVKRS